MTYRARTEGLNWREVDGQAVILDLRSSTYLTLNGTGLTVWSRLQAGATRSELATALEAEHAATAQDAERDVEKFLDELAGLELLA